MRLSPVHVVVGCGVTIVLGLWLATVSPPVGTVVTLVGVCGLGLFLAYALRRAWSSGDQGAAWSPGKAHRAARSDRDRRDQR
jgi:hypothetical protein